MSTKTRPAPNPPGSNTPPPLPGTLSRPANHSQSSFGSQSVSTQSFPSDDALNRRRVTNDDYLLSLSRREDHTALPYFYSNFSNPNEVADYLKFHSKGKPGFFLLRPSFRHPNTQLAVSVVVQDKSVRHTNIVIEGSGFHKRYFLVKEKKFESVEELMLFYRTNEVKNLQNVKNVRFLYPVESGRGSRSHDNGSASSESSYDRYTSPGSSAGMVDTSNIPQNRPPLPARPKDLPRRNSSHSSMGSPGAVFSLSPCASGTSMEESFVQQQGGSGSGFPHGASGSQVSLTSNSTGLVSFSSTLSMNVDSRPPAPLPMVHSPSDKNLYYSTPRNVEEDISDRLKEVLKQSERCDCGIPREMSELPLGWTIHRSKDRATYGRIFYQSSKGVTSWKMPEDVHRKLNATHKANLNKISHLFPSLIGLDHSRHGSGTNSGSGGNLDPRQISGSSGSGGQTSGRVEPQVRVTHLTQF